MGALLDCALIVVLWTFGSFRGRKLRFGILMLFLARIALAGLPGVNLDAEISWRAQYFVNLEAQML